MRVLALSLCVVAAVATSAATAGTVTFGLGLDTDNDAATGCVLTTANGAVSGIEQIVTTIVTTSTTDVLVTRQEQQLCVGGTFGNPVVYDSATWPVGLGKGTGGSTAIETAIPLALLPATTAMRAIVVSNDGNGGQDATATFAIALQPAVSAPVVPVPLSPWLMLPLSLLLLGVAAWWRRRHPEQTAMLVLLLFVAGSGLVWAATVIRDGNIGDWAGVAPAVTDPAGDPPGNADIVAVFTQQDSTNLYVRIDADVRKDAAVNQAPVVNAGPNQTITLPASASLAGSATDDGLPNPPATLTYAWTKVSGPGSVAFGNAANAVTTASFGAAGSYVLRLTASDSALAGTADVTITVNDVTPTGPQIAPIADRTIVLGTRFQQLVQASTGSNPTLSYSLPAAPTGAGLAPAPLIDWTPTAAQLGPNAFTARVVDGLGQAATASFTVTVTHINQPPQLGPQASLIIPVGTAFARTLTASDPDAGDALTFALVAGPTGMTLSGAALNWSTSGRSPGDYTVTVKVTDGAGLFDQKTFTVTLMQAAPAPVAKDDRYEVRVGQTLTVPAAGVLGNDLSLGGSPLSAIRLTNPDKGTLDAFRADGGFTYTAPATLPAAPGLSPVVSWRLVAEYNNEFALAADFDHDGVVDHASSYLGDFRAWRGSDGAQLWQWDRSITTHADVSGCGTAWNDFALGDVTGGGDIYLFSTINCDQSGYAGYPDRYFAVNASQILAGGKVATQWKSPRLSQPHPGAYATTTSPDLPDPPITPFFAASANGSVPTLAKLTAGGSTKLLSRFLAASTYGSYYNKPNSSSIAYAGCRTMTGLPEDEGRACKATYVFDATTGAIDQVLTAPNAANQEYTYNNTPTAQNIPIVADLDGDGQVEIISGGDVWKRVGGVWTLAWQAQFNSVTPGVKLGFEPTSVAVADLDGDGKAEVIIHIIGYDNGPQKNAGGIHIFNHDGTLRRTIPILFTWINGLLSVADVDGDGAPEILLAGDSFVYAYRQDGTLLWAKLLPDIISDVVPAITPIGSTPHTTDSPLYVYDLDLDGVPEVIIQGTRRLFILNGRTGAELWSIDTESDGYYKHGNPLLVDADGDGHVDIVVHLSDRWNCDVVTCKGNAMRISGGSNNWAPGPKVQNQLNFRPAATDAAAKILYDSSVRRDFRQQAQQGTVIDPRAAQTTSFTYKANDGALDSLPATAVIDIKPQNRPPVITSTPPTGILSVTPYSRRIYTITATDPDPGDTVHYEFVSSTFDTTYFAGPVVDSVTGGVDMHTGPCGSYGGPCDFGRVLIVVAAVDAHGARTEQSFFIDITYVAVAVPNVIGQLQPAASAAIEAASLTPRVVTERFGTQPAGTVIGQDPAAGTANVPRSATVQLTVSKGPAPFTMPFVVGQQLAPTNALLAAAGLSVDVTTAFSTTIPAGEIMAQSPVAGTVLQPSTAAPVALTVSAGGPLPAPIASIVLEPGPGPLLRLAGEELQYKAVAILTDGTSADVTLTAAWASSATGVATIDGAGFAKAIASGTTTISASLSGRTGQGTLNVAARVLGDNTPPVAVITSPTDGASVTGPTPIVGTASNANFLRYELAIAPAGETAWTLIGEGTAPVTNGALGTLDPTTLVNDLYTLRLTVFDRSENESVATTTVQLTGNRKVGLFSLTFNDLTIPMAGIPIVVNRTYDSRDKTPGDFGIGWRLGLQTLRLRANRVLGTGWVRTVTGPTVSLTPTSEHKVSITLADGRVEEFDMIVSPTANLGSLDFTNVTGFQPRSGTLGQLQALGNNSLLIVNGGAQDELVDDATLNTYAPTLYRYTTVDGSQMEISPTDGVRKVTDRNGNAITFGPGGIIHSAGKSVLFNRDLQGRITQIADPMGNVQNYTYDGNGDLIAHTNAASNIARYAYNRSHGLIDIRDPAGNHSLRNDYDASGRLIATTDANGNQITYTHDLASSEETVRDRLGSLTLFDYDAVGNVVAKTDALGKTRTYTYDSRNNPLTETDPLGRVSGKTYDSKNNVLTRTDFDGNTTVNTYDALGKLLTTTDPEGRTTTNVYDASGNLTQATDPEGGLTRFTYNAAGKILTRTDPLNRVTTYTYDGAGNTLSETDPLGHMTTFSYDSSSRLLRLTDAAGRTEHRAYDGAGRLTAITDKLGYVTTITYSNVGDGRKLASRTDALGKRTRFDYDALGNLTSTTLPDGAVEATAYDAENRVITAINRDGRTTTFQYDALGRKTRTTQPDGSIASTTWDAVDRMLTQTDERGNTTTLAYAPNRQTVTDALGHASVHQFDSQRRRLQFTDALSRITRFSYDSAGKLTRITFPDGSFHTSTYDAAKQLTAQTDQAGRTTGFDYDAAGRLIGVTDAVGGVTAYAYDAVGNRIAQIDANGHVTQLTYDALGRVLSRIRPSGKQESFVYDGSGNQVSHTDFNGQATTFVADPMGRILQQNLPGGTTVTYAWTPGGLRAQAGGDTFAYDARGRLAQEHKASGETLTYTHDGAGNKASVTAPQGTTTYTHDVLNRLATVVEASGTTTYGYDAVGNLASTAAPNGVTTTYGYDALNRLTQLTHAGPGGVIAAYTYTLGPAGHRVQVVESGPATAGRTVAYTRDGAYRLMREKITQPSTPDVTIDYAYDAAGNRTQMTRDGVLTTSAYDSSDRLIIEVSGGTTYTSTYDDNGNLIGRSGAGAAASYAFDAQNRLVGASDAHGSVNYTYDADGMRTGKTAGGATTTFLLDKAGSASACCDDDGPQLAQVLAETTGANVVTYAYGHGLIRQTRTGSGTHFHLADGQWSTRHLTNASGVVTDRYTFDAFGVTLSASGATPNHTLYAGEQFDPDVGFYYLRARYYQQASGRFISTDPEWGNVVDPASLHQYLYAYADPVDYRDPTGRSSLGEQIMVSSILGVLLGSDFHLGGSSGNTTGGSDEPVARVQDTNSPGKRPPLPWQSVAGKWSLMSDLAENASINATNATLQGGTITRRRGGQVVPLAVNEVLYIGDVVTTNADTVASLEFFVGGRVGINRGTSIEVVNERSVVDYNVSIGRTALKNGSLWLKWDAKDLKRQLEIQTNGGTMAIKG